jgi:hypothetical protein
MRIVDALIDQDASVWVAQIVFCGLCSIRSVAVGYNCFRRNLFRFLSRGNLYLSDCSLFANSLQHGTDLRNRESTEVEKLFRWLRPNLIERKQIPEIDFCQHDEPNTSPMRGTLSFDGVPTLLGGWR